MTFAGAGFGFARFTAAFATGFGARTTGAGVTTGAGRTTTVTVGWTGSVFGGARRNRWRIRRGCCGGGNGESEAKDDQSSGRSTHAPQ